MENYSSYIRSQSFIEQNYNELKYYAVTIFDSENQWFSIQKPYFYNTQM